MPRGSKKFVIEIVMGNDAMQTPKDVAKAAFHIAKRLLLLPDQFEGKIKDDNGNTVGHFGVVEDSGHPDFADFARQLRDEAEWVTQLHKGDKADNGTHDARVLHDLSLAVERVGRNLGFVGSRAQPSEPEPEPAPEPAPEPEPEPEPVPPWVKLTKPQRKLLQLMLAHPDDWEKHLPVPSGRAEAGGMITGLARTREALEAKGLIRWLRKGEMFDFAIAETSHWVVTDKGRDVAKEIKP